MGTFNFGHRGGEMLLLCCSVAFLAALAFAAPESDRVHGLPGFEGELPSAHYSGFVPVRNKTRMLHYYLQEADEDASNKPLILWLNGGPGASSLIGAFTELGQLVFNRYSTATMLNTPRLFRNPSSWTTVANVLFLESPAGVGFSYCVDAADPCMNTDEDTAEDNAEFLQTWMGDMFAQEFSQTPLYLTGESYAGIYLPMLARLLMERGEGRSIAGIAIGNGCWGTGASTNCGDLLGKPSLVWQTDAEFFNGKGLISDSIFQAANAACRSPGQKQWTDPLPATCGPAYSMMSDSIGRINIDNVDDSCPMSDPMSLSVYRKMSFIQRVSWRTTKKWAPRHSLSTWANAGDSEALGESQMWCGADLAMSSYLKMPSLNAALHLSGRTFYGGHFNYTVSDLDLRPLYVQLASRHGMRFVIYNGQSDANVPWLAQTQFWADNSPDKFNITVDWKPWYTADNASVSLPAAGHFRRYTNNVRKEGTQKTFDFVVISGAGHEVPEYKPRASLAMLKAFLLN